MSQHPRESARKPPDSVVHAMADFVEPFVSAIGIIKQGDDRDPPGDHHGTGGFIRLKEMRYLLTCEHVARDQGRATLAFSRLGSELGLKIPNAFSSHLYPVDAAASPLPERLWTSYSHSAKCATSEMLAPTHKPIEGEYLYVYGFPGTGANAAFGQHVPLGVGLFTFERPYDPDLDGESPRVVDGYHICLGFAPQHASVILGSRGDLPLAGGMSGSLVWNTRYREITNQGLNWKPEESRITALVWGHSTKAGMLIATPIEHIHPLLRTLD